MLRGKQVGGIEEFLDVGGEQGRQDRVCHARGHIFRHCRLSLRGGFGIFVRRVKGAR